MAPHNKIKKKLSTAELQKKREIVLARKAVIAENKAKELELKSAIFRKTPGKILWWFCLIISIFCSVILIDGLLAKEYTKFDIHSFAEDKVDVIAGDGWWGQGGRHSESRETWGHSMIIDPWGTVLAELDSGEGFVVAEMDTAVIQDIRMRMPMANHIRL